MSIGYACLTVGISGVKQRTFVLKNATPENLQEIIRSNLASLDKILDYNIQNGIDLFRISSDLIPFGSHPINTLNWWEIFACELSAIGQKAIANGMRLSMHPGQYTVLNSPDDEVVARAVLDLRYHVRILDAMGLGREHKIILHVGGVYGNKELALERFSKQYRRLAEPIRGRLVIENDDRQYTISDVLDLGIRENIPVVFDNLHHAVNSDDRHTEFEWIDACRKTWSEADGPQKIHYSQQSKGKKLGAHSQTLDMDEFMRFYSRLSDPRVDIMVEVKDKNLSAVKCINTIGTPKIRTLEKEWERYKYLVLERSPNIYNEIRQLLKDKQRYPVILFYKLIDQAMATQVTSGNAVNAAQHVWGYVDDVADVEDQLVFHRKLDQVSQGGGTLSLKRLLWKLVEIKTEKYLMNSFYFMELF